MREKNPTRWFVMILMLLATVACCQGSCDEEPGSEFSLPSGPYLGQTPPDLEPALFAPGVVSTGMSELNSVFSPDGTEFYFTIDGPRRWVIMVSYLRGGVWSEPEAAGFQGPYGGVDMAFSPDGNRLYYCTNRPPSGAGEPEENVDIWYVERTDDGWSEPINPGPPINSEFHEFYPSFTTDGTIYFQSRRPGGPGPGDIFRSRLVNGEYREAEALPAPINTEESEGDALIAPDESFLIVTARWPDGSSRHSDLWVSFRREDDSWTERISLGDGVNSDQGENCPVLSPDGRYFFFTSRRIAGVSGERESYDELHDRWDQPAFGHGHADIYWVDAKLIEELRPAE